MAFYALSDDWGGPRFISPYLYSERDEPWEPNPVESDSWNHQVRKSLDDGSQYQFPHSWEPVPTAASLSGAANSYDPRTTSYLAQTPDLNSFHQSYTSTPSLTYSHSPASSRESSQRSPASSRQFSQRSLASPRQFSSQSLVVQSHREPANNTTLIQHKIGFQGQPHRCYWKLDDSKICPASYSSSLQLQNHVKSVHESVDIVKRINCSVRSCPRNGGDGFEDPAEFWSHLRTDHGRYVPTVSKAQWTTPLEDGAEIGSERIKMIVPEKCQEVVKPATPNDLSAAITNASSESLSFERANRIDPLNKVLEHCSLSEGILNNQSNASAKEAPTSNEEQNPREIENQFLQSKSVRTKEIPKSKNADDSEHQCVNRDKLLSGLDARVTMPTLPPSFMHDHKKPFLTGQLSLLYAPTVSNYFTLPCIPSQTAYADRRMGSKELTASPISDDLSSTSSPQNRSWLTLDPQACIKPENFTLSNWLLNIRASDCPNDTLDPESDDDEWALIENAIASFKRDILEAICSNGATGINDLAGPGTTSRPAYGQSQESSSQPSSTHNSSHSGSRIAGKRPVDNEDPETPRDGEDRKGKKAKVFAVPSGRTSARRLACPFHQRNPHSYQNGACTGPGWWSCTRLKGSHLAREPHRRPIQCPRCWGGFESKVALSQHLQLTPICDPVDEPEDERISEDVWEQLGDRTRFVGAKTEEDKWRIMYTILFPGEFVPSPYYPSSSSDVVSDYSGFLKSKMPKLLEEEVAVELEGQFNPVYHAVLTKLPAIVERCNNKALALYNAQLSGSNSHRSDSAYGSHDTGDTSEQGIMSPLPTSGSQEFPNTGIDHVHSTNALTFDQQIALGTGGQFPVFPQPDQFFFPRTDAMSLENSTTVTPYEMHSGDKQLRHFTFGELDFGVVQRNDGSTIQLEEAPQIPSSPHISKQTSSLIFGELEFLLAQDNMSAGTGDMQ